MCYLETVGKYYTLIKMEIYEDHVSFTWRPHLDFPLDKEGEEDEESPVVSSGVPAPQAFLILYFFFFLITVFLSLYF